MIDPSTRLRRAILLNDVALVDRVIRSYPHLLSNPDFVEKSNTSLHLAAANGCTEVVEHLIQAGHDRQEITRNADYETALMLAARGGHVAAGTAIAHHFPRCIAMTNRQGLDALSLAAQNPAATNLISVLLNHTECPASPHVRDAEGNTPLHHASASGSLKALRVLLAAGADPLAMNGCDWTPLAYSQTVAAEVYFKNLVVEFEKRKAEGAKQVEEREKAMAAGMRVVEDDERGMAKGGLDDDELIEDALKRHWSPVERRRPHTPGGTERRHDWGSPLIHMRTRSGSGG